MIQVVYRSGPFKGTSVLTASTRQSAQEYLDSQRPGIREHLGILETRNGMCTRPGERGNLNVGTCRDI